MNNDLKNKKVTFRRLLLSKQLYSHGVEHSNKINALDKMIAIHNFHNAIEITLRAILLYYNIRPEKSLNIEFEVLLNEVDNFKEFKDKKRKLPYRQQIRNLNQIRNHVQHDALEPTASTMEDLRVFARNFLIQVFHDYFGLEFSDLTVEDLIEDLKIRKLLKISNALLEHNDHNKSIIITKIAFDKAFDSLESLFSDKHYWYDADRLSRHDHDENLVGLLKEFEERIIQNEQYFTLLGAGINLLDYKRFVDATPTIHFANAGNIIGIHLSPFKTLGDEKFACWAFDFVAKTIIQWQSLGLEPNISDKYVGIQEIIDTNGASLDS